MANSEHVEVVKAGKEAIEQWRRENQRVALDLSNATLDNSNYTSCDFSNSTLCFINLSKSDLLDVDFSGTDLRNANLSFSNLSNASFSGADLRHCDMRGSELNNVDLSNTFLNRADLRSATITGSDLSDTHLDHAYLRSANLSGSDLSNANLHNTNICDANLHNVILNRTVFIETDISRVKNIDQCNHKGPCVLDRSALIKSDPLPEVFLRGCGLQDWEIEVAKLYQPGLRPDERQDIMYKIFDKSGNGPISFYSCFISYSHKNKAFAKWLYDVLQNSGVRCWLDEHQMLPGDEIHKAIDRGIHLWDKVLLCCSESSLTSWWVDNEIQTAFGKERKISKERGEKVMAIIPLNLDGYLFDDAFDHGYREQLRTRVAANFVGWDGENGKFDGEIAKLLKALRADGMGRELAPERKL